MPKADFECKIISLLLLRVAIRVVDFPKDFRSREREFPEISPGIPGNSREL